MWQHSGLNIGFGQAGIGIKQISFRRTFSELSENQLNGNTRATDVSPSSLWDSFQCDVSSGLFALGGASITD